MKRRLIVAAAAMLGVLACGRGAGGSAADQPDDTLTRREKDSLISTMPVPGAGRVMDARRAADQANERAQRHDTIR